MQLLIVSPILQMVAAHLAIKDLPFRKSSYVKSKINTANNMTLSVLLALPVLRDIVWIAKVVANMLISTVAHLTRMEFA